MTERELTQLASTGESASLEFKHRVPDGDRIAREVIAFANSEGGRLLVGVQDDGTVAGVVDPAEEEFALRRALEQHSQPVVSYEVARVALPSSGRHVLVVTVRESERKPHLLVNGSGEPGAAYVRVEDMSVEASPEALRLMRSGGDEANGVTFEFGDREQMLMRYLDDYGRVTVRQFATLIDEPREEVSGVLTTLVQAGVLQLHTSDEEDYFTLAY
jgi:predicted HTH transcriptional regulator